MGFYADLMEPNDDGETRPVDYAFWAKQIRMLGLVGKVRSGFELDNGTAGLAANTNTANIKTYPSPELPNPMNQENICQCGHPRQQHSNQGMACGQDLACGCEHFRPASSQPSLKSPESIERIIKEFMETLCPCRWIITTPEHAKKDCPHYTFAPERDFITQALHDTEQSARATPLTAMEVLLMSQANESKEWFVQKIRDQAKVEAIASCIAAIDWEQQEFGYDFNSKTSRAAFIRNIKHKLTALQNLSTPHKE